MRDRQRYNRRSRTCRSKQHAFAGALNGRVTSDGSATSAEEHWSIAGEELSSHLPPSLPLLFPRLHFSYPMALPFPFPSSLFTSSLSCSLPLPFRLSLFPSFPFLHPPPLPSTLFLSFPVLFHLPSSSPFLFHLFLFITSLRLLLASPLHLFSPYITYSISPLLSRSIPSIYISSPFNFIFFFPCRLPLLFPSTVSSSHPFSLKASLLFAYNHSLRTLPGPCNLPLPPLSYCFPSSQYFT